MPRSLDIGGTPDLSVEHHVWTIYRFDRDQQLSLGQVQRGLNRLCHSPAWRLSGNKAVDDDIDRVFHLLVELQVLCQLYEGSINSGAQESAFQQIVEQVFILTLLTLD